MGHYCVRMTKILDFKIRKEKKSYERCVYELVDDSSIY